MNVNLKTMIDEIMIRKFSTMFLEHWKEELYFSCFFFFFKKSKTQFGQEKFLAWRKKGSRGK